MVYLQLSKENELLLRKFIQDEKLDIDNNIDEIIGCIQSHCVYAMGLYNIISNKLINCDEDNKEDLGKMALYYKLMNILE